MQSRKCKKIIQIDMQLHLVQKVFCKCKLKRKLHINLLNDSFTKFAKCGGLIIFSYRQINQSLTKYSNTGFKKL